MIKIPVIFIVILVFGCFSQLWAQPEWQNLEPMQTPRWGHAVAAVGDRIYVFGGVTHRGIVLNSTEIYNIESNQWVSAPALPGRGFYYLEAVAVGTDIYLIGGKSGEVVSNQVIIFDTQTLDYRRGTPLPEPRYAMSCLRVGSGILLMGGRARPTPALTSGFMMNIRNNEWISEIPELNLGRSNFDLVVGETVYAVAGLNFVSVNTIEYLAENSWEELCEIQNPRAGASSEIYNDTILVAGGTGGRQGASNFVSGYDISENEWVEMPDLIVGRVDFPMIKYEGKLYAIGGRQGGNRALADVEMYEEEVSITDPIRPIPSLLSLSAYPNPTNGQVFISLPQQDIRLQIVDVSGHILLNTKVTRLESTYQWDSGQFPAGNYYYSMFTSKGIPIATNRITVLK